MTVSAQAPITHVYLDGTETLALRPIELLRATGLRPDTAAFELHAFSADGSQRLSHQGLIANRTLASFCTNETVEVTIERDGGADEVVHFGRVVQSNVQRDDHGEGVTVVSRFDPHMYGAIIEGPLTEIVHKREDGLKYIAGDVIFNPITEKRAWPNRSLSRYYNGSSQQFSGFVHVGQLARDVFSWSYNEQALENENVAWWDLKEAIRYLCYVLNWDETYIQNPTTAELDALFATGGNQVITGVRLARGMTLPEALERLLEPHGIFFYTYYESLGARRIALFRRNSGAPVYPLKVQAYGTEVTRETDNVESLDASIDLAHQAANVFIGEGGVEYVEFTLTLYPGWDGSLEETAFTDLKRNAPAWDTNPELARVWRDWVANEALDYGADNDANKDIHLAFVAPGIRRRRRLRPCITSDEVGMPIGLWDGVQVEFREGESDQWRTIDHEDDYSIKLLIDEIGIRFDGEDPAFYGRVPLEIRVTASVEGDVPIRYWVDDSANSLLEDQRPEIMDGSRRFQWRYLHESSKYKDEVDAGVFRHTQADDRQYLQDWTDSMIAVWNQATIDGMVALEGVHFETQSVMGKSISGLDGRAVSFRANHTNKTTATYPCVVGIRYRIDSQQTVLILDTFRGRPRMKVRGFLPHLTGEEDYYE